jgi:hypothetical protein
MKDNTFTRLPIEVMRWFDDANEWALTDYMYYRSNLRGWKFNLTIIQKETTLKQRKTILRVLNRLVQKGWVTKTSIGELGKHHYDFDKHTFSKWLTLVSNDTVQPPNGSEVKKVPNDTSFWCQTTPELVSNDTVQQVQQVQVQKVQVQKVQVQKVQLNSTPVVRCQMTPEGQSMKDKPEQWNGELDETFNKRMAVWMTQKKVGQQWNS